ncbi:AI-2E family transporter [Thiocystis violacea]|uniref:AI-2E family transporter n=1 Tax=Thiocystis violacea TaxID=13725 RepID=UPI0019031D29|nr:AI-2E family transporter [Thiocystis violacea]MBK1721630.1 AI-2E family transporter [Thiocystis violacea]
MNIVASWFQRNLSDPQVVFLAVLLLAVFAVVLTMGDMLAPVLASIVIAYLLEGLVGQLEMRGVARLTSVLLVYVLFLLFVALVLVGVMPLLSRQITDLVQQLPNMVSEGTRVLTDLPETYPDIVTREQLDQVIVSLRSETVSFGQQVLSWSLASVVGVITIMVYLILMPILVFFFMKDKDLILGWFRRHLSKHHGIAGNVWRDVDRQISNYVRGKAWEILIVWGVSYATFSAFGLKYSMLLSLLVGLSVIIPYIGAALVTVPLLLVAWFQWGWSSQFVWLTFAYAIIQALDGNVLVPLIFSEVVNLHPVAIIVAILVFGGLWGFWGVFFAIPLATLVQAILTAWPKRVIEPPPVAD